MRINIPVKFHDSSLYAFAELCYKQDFQTYGQTDNSDIMFIAGAFTAIIML